MYGDKTKFTEYASAIKPYINLIKDDIKKSPYRRAEYSIKYIKELLGKEFEKKINTEIYWALKYVLWRDYDIIVEQKKDQLSMRIATLDDWKGLLEHGARWD